ncbi:MAG: M23 family metallopeptidase [Clostridia bacterium]|jgi:murein DD-endopeptidase MepM/ murein hydrolase activator NlpD|nr:M23 family metallopeptidase [Clostridia bacterium]
MLKKLFMYTRRSIKLVILISVALLIVVGVIGSFYKVSYIVNIDGEMVGYTDNKSKLQSQINDYIENGEDENAAFVQIESLPEYNMCLLKRDVNSDDDKIFNIIKSDGTTYYRYYAILDNQEEKVYVSNFSEAESIVAKLKEKKSSNTEKITIAEKYETELKEMTSIDDAVSKLYVAPPKKVVVAKKQVNTSTTISNNKVSLGISLSRPVSGIITSRFGVNSSVRSSSHTGLDIATSLGTPVMAAASGTVSYAGWKGSYGKLAVITHENGIQTYYGHCNALYVTAGQTVAQGQTIAAVGSTGNSTGPHLHFEIRVNGVAYNPQNYLY